MPEAPAKRCPRCDTPLTGSETKCPQCQRILTPQVAGVSDPRSAPKCPVCKLAAYAAAVADQPAVHCAECGSVAMKREALMKLQPHGAKALQLSPEERDYKRPPFFEPRKKPPFLICPFCSKKMKETKLGAIGLDLCEECSGVWMERPKFEKLNDWLGAYKWKMSKAKG